MRGLMRQHLELERDAVLAQTSAGTPAMARA
jgi:hypothetical protein